MERRSSDRQVNDSGTEFPTASHSGRGQRPHAVVIGGGVAGLTAAHRLSRAGVAVTVAEGAPRVGGKIGSISVAGVDVDSGAESLLARRPEALRLIADLDIEDRITYPATTTSRIYSRGALRAFPQGQVMGVPGDIAALARSKVVSWRGALRAARDLIWPASPTSGDVSVASYVGKRMGAEVVQRLVEPMLGGVYAGRADRLSLAATLPQLAPTALRQRSLALAAREVKATQAAASDPQRPVFATLRGGVAELVAALGSSDGSAAPVTIETSTTVRELRRLGRQWRLTVGPASDPRTVTTDAVVLACPAPSATRLLTGIAPPAAAELADIDYASMVVVTLALRRSAFPVPPTASGFLVPAREGLAIKAATFSSVKWPWLAEELRAANPTDDLILLRCSIGRVGQTALLQRSDEELVDLAVRDLGTVCGITEPPVDQRVTRWGGALPQYDVGHLDRVARVQAALAEHPTLEVCGAAYNGVGIPACVASAEEAALRVANELGPRVGQT
ncbi:protoporphyrinogen oxidase [Salinactinospora qingdaonensis]|uniref:Coproporphyrinogen III oxidase n=1 Tax=Salinactinospora qingdaonensis TaxID=702744 RepID=A0ABP7EZX0_9ACTN